MEHLRILTFICSVAAFLEPARAKSCAAGWTYKDLDEECYKMVYPTAPSTNFETVALCKKEGGTTATLEILNQRDNEYIMALSKELLKADNKFSNYTVLPIVKEADGTLNWLECHGGKKCKATYTNWGPRKALSTFESVILHIYSTDNSDGHWDETPKDFKSIYPVLCMAQEPPPTPPPMACNSEQNPPPQQNSGGCGCGCGCGCRCGCGC